MTAPDRASRRDPQAAILLTLGALTWLPTRWGVMTTWDSTWLGLDYAAWNRLSMIPLVLLALGAAAATRTTVGRAATAGWAVTAAGFAFAFVGVGLEFVVGGGLQGGPRDIAVAGWTVYLLGLLVVVAGSLVLTAALLRRDRPAALAAGFVAVAFLAWPPLLAAEQNALAAADQLLVTLGWLVLAARIAASTAPRPGAAVEEPGSLQPAAD